jgi:lysozyme
MPNRKLPDFPEAPQSRTPGGKTLAAVLGSAAAAAGLFVLVPQEESGRVVKATVSDDGTATIQHVRGKQYLTAYRDIVGIPTICDGDTKGVRMGMTVTPEECNRRLESQLIAHAEPIIKCAPGLYGRPNQAIAVVSLGYNIGTTGVCRSSVVAKINAGDWAGASNAILLYNRAGEKVNRGLAARRAREKAIFDKGRPAQGVR